MKEAEGCCICNGINTLSTGRYTRSAFLYLHRLEEQHRVIIYTTKMSKQVTKSDVRYSSHVPCELRCRAETSFTRN
jgi:hypothetical protein